MKIEIDYSSKLSIIKDFIVTYKRYFLTLLLLTLMYVSTNQYIKSRMKSPPTVEKTYSKIDLSSDINTLDCKLKQRICFYDNIENTLEKAIENCKDINYCESF